MLKRIRDLREDDDLTQEYIAKIVLNCTRSAYSKMEAGSRLISINDLIKDDFISHAMEVKIFFRKDDIMNIKYISVENSIAEWADKKGILKRWDGLNQYTLNRWIKEMRENRTFSMYVINPTHKLVFINLEGFESFLRWKQKRTK